MRAPSGFSSPNSARALVVVGEELAFGDAHAQGVDEMRADAIERDAAGARQVLDVGVALDQRVDEAHVGRMLEREGVVDRQRARGVDGAERTAVRHHSARCDADEVGAELRELVDDELMEALADAGEQDHRGDADGDAERGEGRAHAVRGQRQQGEADEVVESHRRLIVATGPARGRGGRRAAPA
jgi:hypothetical protein